MADDLYVLLQNVLSTYSYLNVGQPFFVFGESYAGHYVKQTIVDSVLFVLVSWIMFCSYVWLCGRFRPSASAFWWATRSDRG
jgi:hypothetical protein